MPTPAQGRLLFSQSTIEGLRSWRTIYRYEGGRACAEAGTAAPQFQVPAHCSNTRRGRGCWRSRLQRAFANRGLEWGPRRGTPRASVPTRRPACTVRRNMLTRRRHLEHVGGHWSQPRPDTVTVIHPGWHWHDLTGRLRQTDSKVEQPRPADGARHATRFAAGCALTDEESARSRSRQRPPPARLRY